jgi:hypothetical protein
VQNQKSYKTTEHDTTQQHTTHNNAQNIKTEEIRIRQHLKRNPEALTNGFFGLLV